ncbi:Single-stranded-DNA-specific exonuclease RecJ [Aliarcobacter thereius]|uniref:Single-stranded-DNA-specific exonuclease RecJ n=2 Tax=Aliarcobacter thereius TaxID=544718 RepID=A0A1C0B9Y7_9BACT|nr:single-stranded-DNA-specific exonuclease RecJ [Aliarcobacter thereius]OCL88477.1 Single-stranded-DNA-specific exonuclease RecJ [Aliarcobacter thereius]OCL91967.1 Single-stranded-DNA-specific exonuclease RecJ [Aliarcobacter thereius]OCL94935.1 Single-stranded-DNA-specific exonuclease RecJ [Aliarcobacter thereius LMG 24486]OCM00383.1 Single-stranded-DNA-specific exonuclease RecJ [Aliarcobacter thereius]QBF15193.1 single-stranded DNA-specific exonuclease [Aliarcobacter thereius LMG 24486]
MQKITKQRLVSILNARHLNNPYSKLASIPSPDNFKDIKKASQRVKKAINNNERITIIGDYDVDGVVSTSIMIEFFNSIGVKIDYIIPNRFEHGYGLSPKIAMQIKDGLVITVDNGISSIEASKILKSKNIDLIITDHHTVGDIVPIAFAIINPKQKDCSFEYKEICGAQVAWYFCAAIKKELGVNVDLSSYLDLLCLAIIADIMPMTSLNYTMVKQGLKKMKTSNREAFKILNQNLQKSILVSDDIGFLIAPKLNSAGRMDDATIALDFLLSKNKDRAFESLALLDELNSYRKTLQEEITKKAQNSISSDDKAIIVWGENWHEGVIGIVASKLSNAYKKPAFVFSIKDGIAKGSARANSQLNLYDLIQNASDILLGFGGHKNAAGISLDSSKLDEFNSIIQSSLENNKLELHEEQENLGELDIASVDLEFLEIIESFEPYGLENSKPIFKVSKANLVKCELLGRDKNHLKLTLSSSDGFLFEAIKFNDSNLNLDKELNFIVSISKNEFRGTIKPQFLIQEFI